LLKPNGWPKDIQVERGLNRHHTIDVGLAQGRRGQVTTVPGPEAPVVVASKVVRTREVDGMRLDVEEYTPVCGSDLGNTSLNPLPCTTASRSHIRAPRRCKWVEKDTFEKTAIE
jgi:hypothetical protein